MKCWNRVIVGLLAGWVWLICGCGGKKANSPEDSALKNNVYTNRFFHFAVQIPETWTVLKKPTVREMRNAAEALTSGNKQAASTTLQSMARVHCLLLARNVVVGMSISVTAESLAHAPEIQNGEQYLEHALDLFTGPDKPLQRVGQITPVQLFGREFHRVDITGNYMGVRQHQAMFARIEKGHALIFALTAKSPPAVEEAISMVGMDGSVPQIVVAPTPVSAPKKSTTVAAREAAKKESPTAKAPSASAVPEWVSAIKLQGIGGTSSRRLAIINGKTMSAGDGAQVICGPKKTVVIRCVAIGNNSVTITIDGLEGERELHLN